MSYTQAYLLVFLGGPLLMLLLARNEASMLSFVLGVGVVAAALASVLFSKNAPGLGSLGMLWLAWIGTVALCVRAVMRRIKTKRGIALAKSLGAMATVIPWLGLAAADWMAG